MKKIVMAVCLMAVMLPMVSASPSIRLSKNYALSVSDNFNLDGVGAYNFKDSQWMSGISKDVLLLWKQQKKVAYLSAENLFNLNEKGKGAFGLAIGTPIGTLGNELESLVGKIVPDGSVPVWMSKMGSWVSIEGGASYRIFGCPDGQTPMAYTLGGKLKIPVDEFIKLFSGK